MRVEREKLLKCLASVDVGLSAQDVIQQSSCYVFTKGRLWTFNDEVACSCVLPDALSQFECAVPAAEFRMLLSKLTDTVLDVSLGEKDDGKQIILKGGGKSKRRRAGIYAQAEILLPISDIPTPKEWLNIPKGLPDAIAAVEQCASRDDRLFVLTCIHLRPKCIETTDNFQAIQYAIKTGLPESVLVKRSVLSRVIMLDFEQWTADDSWLHFRSQKLTASCRRWQEKFPNISELMKVRGTEAVLPQGVVEAATKAEVFLDDKKEDMAGVCIDISPGQLRLLAEGNAGWYEERQKSEYDGRPMKFRVAPHLLREICSRSDRCVVGDDRLFVKGDHFRYISCLVRRREDEPS